MMIFIKMKNTKIKNNLKNCSDRKPAEELLPNLIINLEKSILKSIYLWELIREFALVANKIAPNSRYTKQHLNLTKCTVNHN